MSSKEDAILSFDVNKVSFPSVKEVTFNKMKSTVLKFAELGGGPFTADEIKEKMKEVGNTRIILQTNFTFFADIGFH